MNLYSYDYIIHNTNIISNVCTFAIIALFVIAAFYAFKYLTHRSNLRYRNILITVMTFAILVVCIQFSKLYDQHSSSSQIGQTVQVMKTVSKEKHIPLKDVYSSDTNFNNGMLIKAGKTFYTADSNTDNTAFHLHKGHPMTSNITYLHHSHLFQFHWNTQTSGQYLNIALKFIVGFALFVLQINLMGKNNLAPSNGPDQIENYVLGGIVGGIIYNTGITLLQFIIIILIWSVIVFTCRVLMDNFPVIRNMIEGQPEVIINNGHVDVDTALKKGLSASQIIFKLRSAGVRDFSNIKRAVLEQNGQFSVYADDDHMVNYPVILDGNLNTDVLKNMHHSQKWIFDVLKQKKEKISDVYLGQIIDGDLSLIPYPKGTNKLSQFAPKYHVDMDKLKHKFDQLTHRKNSNDNSDKNNNNQSNSSDSDSDSEKKRSDSDKG